MIEAIAYGVKLGALWLALCVGAVVAAVALGAFLMRSARVLRRALRPAQLAAFVVAACACALFARKGRVTFPRTDADIAYLTDRGSYVTNDYVRIDFARIIAPDDAHVFVDARPVGLDGDDSAWVTIISSTFSEFAVPADIPFVNATNYDWMVYTTWAAGPAVQTNGVWHAMWGLDKRGKAYLIPIRTAVRVDGETIATPKSKEDANDNN